MESKSRLWLWILGPPVLLLVGSQFVYFPCACQSRDPAMQGEGLVYEPGRTPTENAMRPKREGVEAAPGEEGAGTDARVTSGP